MAKNKILEIIVTAKDRASAVLGRVNNGLTSVKDIAAKVFTAITVAAGAATAAIGAIVVKSLDFGDSLGKSADKLGLTTQELAGLRLAADLAGVSVDGIDNAVKFLNKNISDAALGTGEAKVAFEQLGLSAEDLKNAGPAEAFSQIITKLDGVENAADRTNFAMKIFGRSGADVLNITADGFREATEEAELFGLSLSRADAGKMEDVNDAFTRVKMAFEGAGVQLTIALVDPLKDLGLKLVALAKDGSLKAWAIEIGEIAGQAIDFFSRVILGTGKFTAAIDFAAGSVAAFGDMIRTAFNQAAAFALEGFGQILGGLDALTFGQIDAIGELEGSLKELAEGARIAAQETSESWQKNSDKVVDAWGVLTAEADKTDYSKIAEDLQTTAKAAGDGAEPVKELAESFQEAGKQAEDAKTKSEDYLLAIAKLASDEKIRGLELAVEFNTEKLKADSKIVTGILENIGTAIESTGALMGTLTGQFLDAEGFKDRWFIEDLIKDEAKLRREAFEMQKTLTDSQVKLNDARAEAIESGQSLITIDASNLVPEAEAFAMAVLENVKVRVAEDQAEFLIATQ